MSPLLVFYIFYEAKLLIDLPDFYPNLYQILNGTSNLKKRTRWVVASDDRIALFLFFSGEAFAFCGTLKVVGVIPDASLVTKLIMNLICGLK